MTKRVFNRFDPFMPVKLSEHDAENGTIGSASDVFDDFNKATLNEGLKFGTPQVRNGYTVLLTSSSIGSKNGLGEKLLEDFIFSLSNSFELPQYIILVNEAVLLLGNEKVEQLILNVRKFGVKILVSLESLNYFNSKITNKLVTQATSGDIAEKILFSTKLISL